MSDSESSAAMWDDNKWHRYGLLAGVVFVVLNLASFFTAGAPPSRDASADEIAKYFLDNDSGTKLTAILFAYSVIFGLWWLGSLWRVISRLEPAGPRLAVIAVSGFVMSGVVGGIAQVVFVAPVLRPETLIGTSEFTWTIGSSMYSLALVMIATHMLALAALALWTKFVPSWMGYIALLSALAGVIAAAGIGSEANLFAVTGALGYLVWLAWILVASVLLYRSSAT